MIWLIIRNIVFAILQPGVVIGLIPYLLVRDSGKILRLGGFSLIEFIGCIIFIVGITITLSCIIEFVIKGKGTLSPIDPTKQLVVSGMYRYSRNPMYIGVLFSLLGEALYFQTFGLLVYSVLVFMLFTIFVVLYEEPRLKREFGEEYQNYIQKVPRWI